MSSPTARTVPTEPVGAPRRFGLEGWQLRQLREWMDAVGVGVGPIRDVVCLGGGTQHTLIRFRRGQTSYVLRSPGPFRSERGNKTIQKEAGVLAALGKSRVPHARLIAFCDDSIVIGCWFHLTEAVPGIVPRKGFGYRGNFGQRLQRRLGLSFVECIARLSEIDPSETGLRAPDDMCSEWNLSQANKWRRHFDRYDADGGHRLDLPGIDSLHTWLVRNAPADSEMGVVHGDLHFGNIIVAPQSGDVKAIVDWELASIGDPLLDLGHLLIRWPREPGLNTYRVPYLPSRSEVAGYYADLVRRDVTNLRWFEIMASYRLAAILEGANVRARTGNEDPAVGLRFHENARQILLRATEMVDVDQGSV